MRGNIAKSTARIGGHPKRAVLLAILVASSATTSAQQPRGGFIDSGLKDSRYTPRIVHQNPHAVGSPTPAASGVRSNPFFTAVPQPSPAAAPASAETPADQAMTHPEPGRLQVRNSLPPATLGGIRKNQFATQPQDDAGFATTPVTGPQPLTLDARAAKPIKPSAEPHAVPLHPSQSVVRANEPANPSRVVPVTDSHPA